ncbi:MAG: tRNA (adenosine(37)-N6)-threonylcarbamoyltransferase complex transferase subunit TsaD [Verrucomicrobiota bacterium]
MKRILGIETSCDETSVAVVEKSGQRLNVRAQEIASQIAIHQPFGGVVPEMATRQHLIHLEPMAGRIRQEVGEIDLIAVTAGPGLASSLLIGTSFAKGLAYALGKPLLPVNHMEGHLYSAFLSEGESPIFPHLALIVSGGHTLLVHAQGAGEYQIIGTTRDDAAGEALDKVAKLLGLPYPGGPEIEKRARLGNPEAFDFPRSMLHSGDGNFSFSGLKTSARVAMQKSGDQIKEEKTINDLCASFQAAVFDVLIGKAQKTIEALGVKMVTLSGGVCGNQQLRERFASMAEAAGCQCRVALPPYTGDNAAMIAAAASGHILPEEGDQNNFDIRPSWKLDEKML